MNMSASAPDDTVHTPDDINIIFEKMSYGPAPEASNVVQVSHTHTNTETNTATQAHTSNDTQTHRGRQG